MTTDFRALCAELTDALDTWLMAHHYGGVPPQDGADAKLALRARTALSQPEPVAPTDEALLAMRSWSCHGPTFDSDLVDFGRRCYNLGRYGTPANTTGGTH
jgi:hypothetical protein